VRLAAEYSPFYGIEKSAVLQEARCFNDRELDPRRCAQVCSGSSFLFGALFWCLMRRLLIRIVMEK
jgi:hypothetical protein